MIVYKISNNVNDKCYIGITTRTLEERWNGHISKCHQGQFNKLYNAMRKYGLDNFSIECIDTTDDYQDLLRKEKFYVEKYDTYKNGYNMTLGGDTNPMDDVVIKEIHDRKMRSKETRDAISKSMKKHIQEHGFSEEHRKHLSESAKGNHNFGTGDTRSIGCHCITSNGETFYFHSIKDATKWWFENYKPFGDHYAEPTLQRKIIKSMRGEKMIYKVGKKVIEITNLTWYEGGGDKNNEVRSSKKKF